MVDAPHGFPLGPVAVSARLWRRAGRRHVTVIAKLTCTMRNDAPLFVAPPKPIVVGERSVDGRPGASILHASDVAPILRRPEIVVVGSAFAAPGNRVESTSVRLALVRDGAMLVHKRLDVIGDRRVREGEPEPSPTPFSRMPIVYERAFGGPGDDLNPSGVGREPERDGARPLPNILHPAATGTSTSAPSGPAGFAPIPGHWPLRATLRGALSQQQVDLTHDVELPDDFDDTYFQTAPEDQQLDELRPGDTIMLVNLHPEVATLRATIPDARAVALVQTRGGTRLPVELRLDTLHLEPDASRAEVLFRGSIEIDEADADGLRVAAGIQRPGRPPVEFPDLSTLTPPKRVEAEVPLAELSSTAVIDPTPFGQPPPVPVRAPVPQAAALAPPNLGGTQIIELPSGHPAARPPAPARPGPPPPAPPPAPPARNLASTVLFEDDATAEALPFAPPPVGAPPAPPPPPHAPTAELAIPAFTGTVTIDLETALGRAPRNSTLELAADEAPRSLPFAKRPRGTLERSEAPAPVPGAPWSPEAELAPVPDADEAPMTMVLREPAELAPEPPPAPAPAPPPPPKPEPKPEPPAEPKEKKPLWREDPAPPPQPPPAPKPPPAPRADLRQDLYKRFKR